MTLPKNGDSLPENSRIFTWTKLLAPFVVGVIGACIGGYASFILAKADIQHNAEDIVALERRHISDNIALDTRIDRIELVQNSMAERLVRVETKIDILLTK